MFAGNHLRWMVDRPNRFFRTHVVEPERYDPSNHGRIFNDVLTQLISPAPVLIDGLGTAPPQSIEPEPFDLVTFPEAFVPAEVLLDVLGNLNRAGPIGCIHVGLRPSDDPQQHLFTHQQALDLITKIGQISDEVAADIAPLVKWISSQRGNFHFNLGCLFTVDADGNVRVCVHPKVVRSKFECSPLPERHLEEADFLTLVSLLPVDKNILTVTLQPLICSDVLSLSRDRGGPAPIAAVNSEAACFGDSPPDHIDVVSAVTCTPQAEVVREGHAYRAWHQEFQRSFVNAASDGGYFRHHFAVFVLSNFRMLPKTSPGGLSGVFVPTAPPTSTRFHDAVIVSLYGRPNQDCRGNNRWSTPEDGSSPDWSSRGFVAALDPYAGPREAVVRIFACNIQPLPRHDTPWSRTRTGGLARCEVSVGMDSGDRLAFVPWSNDRAD